MSRLLSALDMTLAGILEELEGYPVHLQAVGIGLPEEVELGAAHLRAFFAEVWDRGVPGKLDVVVDLARSVRVGLGGDRWGGFGRRFRVMVAGDLMEAWSRDRPLSALLQMDSWGRRLSEPHLGGLMLALAWMTPGVRAWFERPLWELLLLGGPAQEVPDDDEPEASHEGYIRYALQAPAALVTGPRGHRSLDWTSMVERSLMRRAVRGERWLKPIKMPGSIDAAAAKVSGVREVDRLIDAELRRVAVLQKVFVGYGGGEAGALRQEIEGAVQGALAHMAKAREVHWCGSPIEVTAEEVLPSLVTEPREDGGLSLSWSPPCRRVMDVGAVSYVLVDGKRLAPLSATFPAAMRALLAQELPDVPASDVGRFVRRFAAHAPVPVVLERGAEGTVEAERVEPRLLLSEADGALKVEPRFGYHLGDQAVEVLAASSSPLVLVNQPDGEPAMVARQRKAEGELLESLSGLLGGRGPWLLEETDAYDFLVDHLPSLVDRWTVYGEGDLTRHRVHRSVSVGVGVESGVDWFDLEVRFEAGGAVIPTGDVLTSWLEGRRYHRLADGSVARLPRRWLARHGEALAELEEVRLASGSRLGAFAAPLAGELLELAGEGAASLVELARTLRDFDGVPPFEPLVPVNATLRPYQTEGTRWLAFLRDRGLGGVLADDMGLGKTLQVLVVLADTHARQPDGPPSLVVAPASVVHNWALEARRFVPSLRVHVHHGQGRGETLPAEADVIVTSYNMLRLDEELLCEKPLQYAVLDEAQKIKNPQSQVARAAGKLKAAHRLALTGTPLENHLYDLWSLFQFVMPGFFGRRSVFSRRYAGPIHREGDAEALAALRARVKPFVLRRLKSEVASDLPPRQEQVLYCELGSPQRKLYDSIRRTYRSTVLSQVDERGVEGAKLKILEALTRLRQACCDASLVPLDEARAVVGSAKLELLMETLEEAVESGHRTLIFSQWPSLLKLARARTRNRGWGELYLDGGTPAARRAELVELWNDPSGPPLFYISLKAGGTGLNLTGADHVIHLDPWWNPAVEDQATDRAHRIGQTLPVVVYRLVARDTVEEKILELQDRKRQLMEATVDEDRMIVEALTRSDIEAVFAEPGADALT